MPDVRLSVEPWRIYPYCERGSRMAQGQGMVKWNVGWCFLIDIGGFLSVIRCCMLALIWVAPTSKEAWRCSFRKWSSSQCCSCRPMSVTLPAGVATVHLCTVKPGRDDPTRPFSYNQVRKWYLNSPYHVCLLVIHKSPPWQCRNVHSSPICTLWFFAVKKRMSTIKMITTDNKSVGCHRRIHCVSAAGIVYDVRGWGRRGGLVVGAVWGVEAACESEWPACQINIRTVC